MRGPAPLHAAIVPLRAGAHLIPRGPASRRRCFVSSSALGRPWISHASATATTPPISGANTYTHHVAVPPATIAGPSVRAGFIEPPEIGYEIQRSKIVVAPFATADCAPMIRPLFAVEMFTTIRIAVSTISYQNAGHGPSTISACSALAGGCRIASTSAPAAIAPANCAITYRGTRDHGKSPRSANAIVVIGLVCAPDTVPNA